jgi:hypothetical protein
MLYNALYGRLSVGRLMPYLSWEIAVACSTPGFGAVWWGMIMAWGDRPHVENLVGQIIAAHVNSQEKLRELGYENSLSITQEDGLDWLRTMLKRKPYYRGPVPSWTRMALRQLREEQDWSNKQLASHLGLRSTSRLGAWLTEVREV